MVSFGARMRMLRVYMRVTQEDLARDTGLAQSVISMIERDEVTPGEDAQARIREALAWTPQHDRALDMLEAQ